MMMMTKLTVMVAEIRQVRLRVQSLNRSKLPESYSTYHFKLVTKVDSGVYCAHIMCHLLFQCFFNIEQIKKMKFQEEEERYHIESN